MRRAFAFLFLLPLACRHAADPAAGRVPACALPLPEPDPDSRMAWWREARFGMFVHWGLYAIPEGQWGSETGHAEWIRTTARIPIAEYEKLKARFDPVKFDAGAWARLARRAGMKYLVITSKHHDGFGLFDSALTDWDVGGAPFGRDVLAELSAACEREGVRFCTYHSIMDWHHPDYLPRRDWEGDRSVEGADFERFERYLHGQVEEVVRRYKPAVMWFDGEWEATWSHERGLRLLDLCRRLDPRMIVNNRVDVHRGGMGGFSSSAEAVGDFATPEQEVPATGVPGVDWESCITVNDHWGWNRSDRNWKGASELVRMLVDVASKGGNLLLNVGPKPDGTFPDEAVLRLEAIGAWMDANAESIHGTTASPFDALSFGRCTTKAKGAETRLFLHVFRWPRDLRLALPGLGNEIGRAYLLAEPGADLPRAREGTDVWIGLPETAPDPVDTVVVLEIAGAPVVYRAPRILADSDVFVRPLAVRIESGSPELEVRFTTDGSEPDGGSAIYGEPFALADTAKVRARAFHRGKAVSAVSSARFERVRPEPPAGISGEGFLCMRYRGTWDRVPDFATLEIADSWRSHAIALPAEPVGEHVALQWHGTFSVPAEDVWLFDLASDDGSLLWIDGELVVDNDGLHGTETKRGRIALAAGPHRMKVGWFNRTGGAELSLKWSALTDPARARPR